ncbi:MAG: thymidine phosphorylase [Coriobacteriia bacterium]|nr:thymidine phosphorylase [Coriobacteriia bacterium]
MQGSDTRSLEELIELKRDGGRHERDEIVRLVSAFVSGEMPDYQMAAWLMAALLNGLDGDETVWLTDAMARSGRMIDLSSVPGVKVDKHSTGGVGDKTTLVLGPLVASCGVPIAKMSGRALGHTGGTLDKLESIPGFRVEIEPDAFIEQVRTVGMAVIAQSPDIDPADKKMYALRDVTATVPSVPLIVGSIISKKIAGGADAIVLDVKVGSGAFMKSERDARMLARELRRVGEALGRTVVCVMTDMDQPLGHAVGNALEVREAISTLRGDGPKDLTDLCVALGAKMLVLGGRATDEAGAAELLRESIRTGRALDMFRRWVEAQGGDPRIADDPDALPFAARTRTVGAPSSGWVAAYDTEGVGKAAMVMGAGRAKKEDVIDHAAGIVLHAKVGDRIEAGAPLATLHAATDDLLTAGESRFLQAVRLIDGPVPAPALFHEL